MAPEIPELTWTEQIKYDEKAALVKMYCYACGHETGEERPHAKDCPCQRCLFNHQIARLFSAETKGKPITFPKFAPISGEDL